MGHRVGLSEMACKLNEWSTKCVSPTELTFDTPEEAAEWAKLDNLSPRLQLPPLQTNDPLIHYFESDSSNSSEDYVPPVHKLRKLCSSNESSSDNQDI